MTPTTPLPTPQSSRHRPTLLAWALLLPMLAWLALFVVLPTAILFIYSFCHRDALGQIVWSFTFTNYRRVIDPTYLRILLMSTTYAALTTVLCAVIGYPVAYFIARSPEPRRSRLLTAIMIPFWTSFLIRTYAWIAILQSEGLLNALLKGLHLITNPLDILYTPTAVMIGLVYAYLPFMILPIYASVEKLDTSLIEAALDLGAKPASVFRHVILPLTRPGIAAGAVLVFVPAIGMFAVTDLMGGAKAPLIGNVIQNQFLQARDWPFGSALGITLLAMFAIAYAIANRRREVL